MIQGPIYDPFYFLSSTLNESLPAPNKEAESMSFDDPDGMYELWLKPTLDVIDSPFSPQDMIEEMATVQDLYLDLSKTNTYSVATESLNQLSIQISVYEAIIFRDIFLNTTMNRWQLKKQRGDTHCFEFSCRDRTLTVTIQANRVVILENNHCVGELIIDMEHMVVEKLHGTLFEAPFVLDPVWHYNQKKVQLSRIIIDQYRTDVGYKPMHRFSLWRTAGRTRKMTLRNNHSIQVHPNLIANIKKIRWQNHELFSMQWYTPWFRFPLHACYQMCRL